MIPWDINGIYPLVICYIAIENGPVEIVDLPMKNGGSFHSYVNDYQRVSWGRSKHGGFNGTSDEDPELAAILGYVHQGIT